MSHRKVRRLVAQARNVLKIPSIPWRESGNGAPCAYDLGRCGLTSGDTNIKVFKLEQQDGASRKQDLAA